jgi:hypothetical protein
MNRRAVLIHEFVENFPNELKDGMIYVSIPFATAAHRCCCGCGEEVITPLSRTDWKLTFDGESISLDPSIGNWNFACKSHYWIIRNTVKWARRWSQKEIETGRVHDRLAKKRYFDSAKTPTSNDTNASPERPEQGKSDRGPWRKPAK